MALYSFLYRHQLDEKSRIRIPPKVKELLGDNPFIMRGPNGCLVLYKKEEAETMLTDLFSGISLSSGDKTKAQRIISSSGFFAEEDKQGRITIPSNLIKQAGLTKNIVTVGAGNRVEIWDEAAWNVYSDVSNEEYDKLFDILEQCRREP
ncbi:MAG: cell division/cell wall cluster transcriptional repressor MraZ [Firmicutes bacterium]|nr:cell division/cell wall cluster transcriptional repressor MraZ [Bacillota bacterium]